MGETVTNIILAPTAIGEYALDKTIGYNVKDLLGDVSGYTARKEQERANKARANIQRLQQQRQKQQMVKEARRATAATEVQAQSQGVGGASSTTTATSGIQQQVASNISFLDQAQGLGDFISSHEAKAAKSRGRQDIFNTAIRLAPLVI